MTDIRTLVDVTEYPLCWPDSKPRSAKRRDPDKSITWNATMAAAREKIDIEMHRIGARGHVVSMNPKHRFGSPDPGAAVWWNEKPTQPGQPDTLRVLACDQFTDSAYNLYAIGLSLDRLRALARYGAYSFEQAIQGAQAALPPPAGYGAPDWRKVFAMESHRGLAPSDQLAIANARYRAKAAENRNDEAALKVLNTAIDAAREELEK